MMDEKPLPEAVIRRLPRYLAAMRRLTQHRSEWVSSDDLGLLLGLTSATIRHDVAYLQCAGVSKRGYPVPAMTEALERILGLEVSMRAVVVGSGPLAASLIEPDGGSVRNLTICGFFDRTRAGEKFGRFVVRGLDELEDGVRKKRADIGVIAVEPSAAQQAADALVLAGVRGMLNLTTANVVVPKSVVLLDGGTGRDLLELRCMMNVRRR